jgi:hypothetical protein
MTLAFEALAVTINGGQGQVARCMGVAGEFAGTCQ